MLAEAYARAGQAERALRTLDQALEAAEANGGHIFDAEIHRLKGEIVVSASASDAAEGEAAFRRAIDIARAQNAKGFKLRAVTSLSRLLQKQGKKDEARQMLAEIYGWFTEGFDIADLKEAKALLEELST
jgi:predicted ATPase